MTEDYRLVAMIHGVNSTLGLAVARELSRQEVRLVLSEPESRFTSENDGLSRDDVRIVAVDHCEVDQNPPGSSPAALLLQRAGAAFGRLDALINLCVPSTATTREELREYPGRLLDRALAACQLIKESTSHGSIVNHCFMPAAFAGTCLEEEMPMLRGAITGITRILCRKFGPRGIRINTVQTGLIDMPEMKSLATAEVLRLKTPVGRWGTPEEVAKFIAFLVLRNGYMTGQGVIMDGGLTAGVTGT